VVYTATSTDSGDTATGATAYSLKAATGDVGSFSINATTGAVTLTGNPDFEAKSSYSFTVVATDAANNASEKAVTLGIINVVEDAPATPQPTSVPVLPPVSQWNSLPDDDGDGTPQALESSVKPLDVNGAVAGDGNGDGIADAAQTSVASVPFLKTPTAVTSPGEAPRTFVSLVADSIGGKPDTTDAGSATLQNVKQLDAPANLPSTVKMPLGQISFDAKVSTVGMTETFSLYVDPTLGINAYWKQDANKQWVNLASSEYGGKVVTEGGKTRLDFKITDGGQFDSDGKADGIITDPGAPGIEKDSDHDQFPDALEAANGLVVGIKDNDVFTSSKFFVMQLYRDVLYREAETGGVARLYFGALQRLPDAAGMDFWMQQEQSGTSLSQIASAFTVSKEFTDIYGSMSNTAFVDKLYLNVQGKTPTPVQESFWVNQLNAGTSRAEVLLGFTDSADYKAASKTKLSVALDYIGLLGRPAEQAGFDWWVEQQDTNIPEVEVIGGFIASTEYHGRFLP
jgi:hypothetical protein